MKNTNIAYQIKCLIPIKFTVMKTINENNFKSMSIEQMNETKGGYYIMITLPNGQKVRVRV